MANSSQARKRARQAEARRKHNMSHRSLLRTRIKQVRNAVAANDKEAATAALTNAVPVIDRMVNKNIIHKNTAARQKSRLSAAVKALG